MNKQMGANLDMMVSKVFSGLNVNALKFLLPLWLVPLTGAAVRCTFGAVAFWVIGLFMKPDPITRQQKLGLLLLGALGLYGFMFLYLMGLSMTTPISSSIFASLEPIWVFLMMVVFYKQHATFMKVLGILIGLGGALLCILTQKSSDLASNALLGNALCLGSSVCYAVFLVAGKRFLRSVGVVTMLKYTFTGAAIVSLIVLPFDGGIRGNLFSLPFHWLPFGVLMFVLCIPTVFSYLLVPIGLKYLSATVVAIYGYLILIVATIVSYILGQDRFDWISIVAILMIVASVYFVEIANNKDKKPVPPFAGTGKADGVIPDISAGIHANR